MRNYIFRSKSIGDNAGSDRSRSPSTLRAAIFQSRRFSYFPAVLILALTHGLILQAQVASSPSQLVRPIMKDPNKRVAPNSLDRDPAGADISTNPHSSTRLAPARPAGPSTIVAKVDPAFAASSLTLIGTVDGLRGTLYVTNVSSSAVKPVLQIAVCDQKGFKVDTITKTGSLLEPNGSEKLVVLGTNLNAIDLKLVRLAPATGAAATATAAK